MQKGILILLYAKKLKKANLKIKQASHAIPESNLWWRIQVHSSAAVCRQKEWSHEVAATAGHFLQEYLHFTTSHTKDTGMYGNGSCWPQLDFSYSYVCILQRQFSNYKGIKQFLKSLLIINHTPRTSKKKNYSPEWRESWGDNLKLLRLKSINFSAFLFKQRCLSCHWR